MPLRPQLLTIIERAAHCGLDDKSVYYNSRLSNGRVLVEQAFGITKQRWRIFLGKTGVSFRSTSTQTSEARYILAWEVACILHNMAITHAMEDATTDFEDALEKEANEYALFEAQAEAAQRAQARNNAVAAAPKLWEHVQTSESALSAGKELREAVKEALWAARK